MKYKVYKKVCLLALVPIILVKNPLKNNEVEASDMKTIYEWMDSLDQLKKFFPEHVTFDDARGSLKENPKISEEYRDYTNEFIDLLEEKYPNIDLTIFNENLKIFEVKEITKKEMTKDKKRESYYQIITTTIYMHDEHRNNDNKKYCYFHELWHMFNNLYIKKGNNIYYKTPSMYENEGTAFDEGMTTFLTEQLFTSNIQGYTKQYDEITILYSIYGDELITSYLTSGVEGVELLLAQDIEYEDACNFIQLMNDEWKKKIKTPLPVFELLSVMYRDKQENVDDLKIYETIDNLCYDESIKQQIKSLFVNPIYYDGDWKVTINGENYYSVDELYFIKCNNRYYLVNDEIVKNYFQTGYIQNIDDDESIYSKGSKICSKISLVEYSDYDIFRYDSNQNILFVDIEKLKGGSYVKSK